MCPRRYCGEKRQAAADETRSRILAAARELLTAGGSFTGFTIDAVAHQAGVARMTVYYQFGSKAGLLEALCDFLAARGQIECLAAAFAQPDALVALADFIAAFGRFWDSDRLVLRRLRALAALDADFEQVIRARDERRREGLRALVRRLAEAHGRRPAPQSLEETVHLLWVLTSFDTFDALAGEGHNPQEVVPRVRRLVWAALGLEEKGPGA